MEHRRLGRTGTQVSEIGLGAWGIGKGWWGEADDTLSVRALARALDLGVTFIDTAYAYGSGHSERLIARVPFDERGLTGSLSPETAFPPIHFRASTSAGTGCGRRVSALIDSGRCWEGRSRPWRSLPSSSA